MMRAACSFSEARDAARGRVLVASAMIVALASVTTFTAAMVVVLVPA